MSLFRFTNAINFQLLYQTDRLFSNSNCSGILIIIIYYYYSTNICFPRKIEKNFSSKISNFPTKIWCTDRIIYRRRREKFRTITVVRVRKGEHRQWPRVHTVGTQRRRGVLARARARGMRVSQLATHGVVARQTPSILCAPPPEYPE